MAGSSSVTEANKRLANALRQKGENVPPMDELNSVLHNTLGRLTQIVETRQAAEIIRDVLSPSDKSEIRREKEDDGAEKESVSFLKSLGLDIGSLTGAAKDAGTMWRDLFRESREDSKEARRESASAQGKLLEMAMALMSSEQKRQMQEIVHKLGEVKGTKNEKNAMSEMLEKASLQVIGQAISRGLGMGSEKEDSDEDGGDRFVKRLEGMLKTVDYLSGWLRKRKEDMGDGLPDKYRSEIVSPEVLKEILADERDRLRLKIEETRIQQDRESRERTMQTFERIAPELIKNLPFMFGKVPQSVEPGGSGQ